MYSLSISNMSKYIFHVITEDIIPVTVPGLDLKTPIIYLAHAYDWFINITWHYYVLKLTFLKYMIHLNYLFVFTVLITTYTSKGNMLPAPFQNLYTIREYIMWKISKDWDKEVTVTWEKICYHRFARHHFNCSNRKWNGHNFTMIEMDNNNLE